MLSKCYHPAARSQARCALVRETVGGQRQRCPTASRKTPRREPMKAGIERIVHQAVLHLAASGGRRGRRSRPINGCASGKLQTNRRRPKWRKKARSASSSSPGAARDTASRMRTALPWPRRSGKRRAGRARSNFRPSRGRSPSRIQDPAPGVRLAADDRPIAKPLVVERVRHPSGVAELKHLDPRAGPAASGQPAGVLYRGERAIAVALVIVLRGVTINCARARSRDARRASPR